MDADKLNRELAAIATSLSLVASVVLLSAFDVIPKRTPTRPDTSVKTEVLSHINSRPLLRTYDTSLPAPFFDGVITPTFPLKNLLAEPLPEPMVALVEKKKSAEQMKTEMVESELNVRDALIVPLLDPTLPVNEDHALSGADAERQAEIDASPPRPLSTTNRTDKQLAKAQENYQLGMDYYHGIMREKDLVQARYWFIKGALGGSKDAQGHLAKMYLLGQGSEKNKERALYWLDMAKTH